MKKFLFSVAAIVLTMCLALTACSKPATDSDVSGNGSSADVTSDVQSTISSENSDFSADNALSAGQSEASTEGRISSEGSADASASEDTSEIVAVVTPPKPDDTSDNVPDNSSSTADISVAPAPIDTPVNVTTGPTEDNTSEEHVHSYKFSYTESRSATCTEDGYAVYKCSCGDSYTEPSGKATGHAWTKWVDDNESRTATRTCQFSRCKQTETKAWEDLFIIKESDIDAICDRILELLNEERAKLGAPALSTAPIAHEMAMVRAEQLTTLFSHTMPDGRDSRFIYKDYQYNPDYPGTGEDGKSNCLPFSSSEDIAAIHTNGKYVSEGYEKTADKTQTDAYNTAYSMIMNFSRSAGHWADLTNPEYTDVGVGYAYVSTPDGFSKYLCVMTMDKTYG